MVTDACQKSLEPMLLDEQILPNRPILVEENLRPWALPGKSLRWTLHIVTTAVGGLLAMATVVDQNTAINALGFSLVGLAVVSGWSSNWSS